MTICHLDDMTVIHLCNITVTGSGSVYDINTMEQVFESKSCSVRL
jgi:hypothetical protein